MTKKDFKAIAYIVSTIRDLEDRKYVARLFANYLQEKNPRFDWDLFVEACGAE